MMNKKLMKNILTGVELACIWCLVGIALKRNNDCYKAELERDEANFMLAVERLGGVCKDIEYRHLKEELKKIKAEQKVEEESRKKIFGTKQKGES